MYNTIGCDFVWYFNNVINVLQGKMPGANEATKGLQGIDKSQVRISKLGMTATLYDGFRLKTYRNDAHGGSFGLLGLETLLQVRENIIKEVAGRQGFEPR